MDPLLVLRLEELAEQSGRFRPQAYFWILQVLEYTRGWLDREGHITGQELLEGQRRLALEEFGPMAYNVLRHWGLQNTADVGQIVFQLVEEGFLRKTEEDQLDDFESGYDFQQVFVAEYPW